MKHFHISVDIDITAQNLQQAERRASLLFADLEQRPWVNEVLPNGIQARRPLNPSKGG